MKVSLVDHGFMDARSKLIDVAAFLDRVDRHGQAGDYRVEALREALAVVAGAPAAPDRAKRVLEVFSDPTSEPLGAATVQGANGAYEPEEGSGGDSR